MEVYKETLKLLLISYIHTENIESLINFLNSSFTIQKFFFEFFEQMINKDSPFLGKLNKHLPNIIPQLRIPFCELFFEHPIIVDYYYSSYLNKNSLSKNILLSFLDIFNFDSIEINPADDLIEKLQLKDPETYYYLKKQRRNNKTEIENLYDEITSLFSNLRIRINIEDDFENEIIKFFELSIKEKLDKINELEKESKYPKAIIEFMQEKMKNVDNLFKNIKKSNLFENHLNNEISPSLNDINKLSNNFNSKSREISNYTTSSKNQNSEFNINEILEKLKEIPLKNRTSLYKDEQLTEGEDEFTEFKNYYFPLTEEKVEELKRQFCAFLNNKGGRLYLGINDQKIVKGVILNYKKCDSLRNSLVNYTYDFYPKCRLDKIKVYFIPIKRKEDNKFINNLFVVKIIVLQGEPYILYSMTNKGFKSALRLQGQCANLTAEEITKEIIRRGKLEELQKFNYSNNQFDDPEPEKNYENDSKNSDNDLIMNNQENNEAFNNNKNKTMKINKRDIFVVEVKNIDDSLDIKELYDKFKDCGSFYQKFFSKDGKSRGYGFLKFSSENLAISTIKKFDNMQIGDKKISLMIKK